MNSLISHILENKKLEQISLKLEENKNVNISLSGLTDSSKAHMIYALTCRGEKSAFVVCSNIMSANKMMQDIKSVSDLEVIYFPARKLEYYDIETQSSEIENARMYAIDKILSGEKNIIVTTVDLLTEKMYSSNTYSKVDVVIEKNKTVNIDNLVKDLVTLGYERADIVEGKGQFAIRGGIIDVFAINNDLPYRIELFGNEVDNIRTFDVITQRSIDTLNKIEISFLKEVRLNEDKKKYIIEKLEAVANDKSVNKELKEYILRDIERIEIDDYDSLYDKYFELFVDEKENIIDYLRGYNLFIDEYERLMQKVNNISYENFETLKILSSRNYVYLPFANKTLTFDDVLKSFSKINTVYLESISKIGNKNSNIVYDFDTKEALFYRNGMEIILSDVKKANDKVILLVFPTDVRVEQVKNYLVDNKIKVEIVEDLSVIKKFALGKVYITKGILSGGYSSEELKLLLVAEPVSGISSRKNAKKKDEKNSIGQNINSYDDLKVGDYIVHEIHGIGIYRGIHTIAVAGVRKDYIKLEYDNNGVLYIPINQLESVKKYVCDDDTTPKINSLNSKEWQKTKAKVTAHVKEMAKELVALYAAREKSKGYAYSKDTPWQREFEDSFAYELTNDQKQAVEEIKNDMESDTIMDRLLCGDVGYGKTEVALRTAFKAICDTKQVAYLVPTTVLCLQQYNTFKSRMESFGIKVEMLCRIRSAAKQKKIIQDLKDGKIDMIVGTHRLLSKDVEFKDLGMLIIDEEHRFGVKAKETIKEMKKTIDVLSMTATPIPRTLHMSMIGVRGMSSLTEPPMERLPVHTYVLEYDENIIKEAIEKELLRDGQVIYLNNRVNNIEEIAASVRKMVPDARIGIAHGQMDPKEIEDIMMQFMNHEIDIIVCTTIFESGIDVPNANTLIVENADTLGLAQLYQIRGRVGRSNKLAYAYITYKKNKQLSEVSEKRLKAIKDFTEFGSGFKIAMRDLEIRGAGNLLGREQHGHMAKVGYEMYLSLLEKAIEKEKQGKLDDGITEVEKEIKIDINVSAYISDSYIPSEIQRIEMYQKISNIETNDDMMEVIDELLDRYGDLPKETENLIKIVEIRNDARKLGITKIRVFQDFIIFEPDNLKIRLTNKNANDILINVQLEIEKLKKIMKER